MLSDFMSARRWPVCNDGMMLARQADAVSYQQRQQQQLVQVGGGCEVAN